MWAHLCECMVCTAPKRLPHTARATEPQNIVAGDHMKRGAFSVSASAEPGIYSQRQHEYTALRSRQSATKDLVFKLK